jgi:hypothetical protein
MGERRDSEPDAERGGNPFARAIDRILAIAPPKRGAAA